MFLDSPKQSLEVCFKFKYEGGCYTVYASSGIMKCFECPNVGQKCFTCPHREQAEDAESTMMDKGQGTISASISKSPPQGE